MRTKGIQQTLQIIPILREAQHIIREEKNSQTWVTIT
jgi:hypothetical protein